MQLVYENSQKPVQIGDTVTLKDDIEVEVVFFRKPHKPASGGKVSVRPLGGKLEREYFVSVIGAVWIDREDRA